MKTMERGQITIPKKFRERYGITRDTELEFIPQKDGLLLVKKGINPSPFRKLYGILQSDLNTDDVVREMRGE